MRNVWNRKKPCKIWFPYVLPQLPVRWRNWDTPTIHVLLFFWPQICASICEICDLRYSGYAYNQMGCNQMGNQMGCNQMNYNQMNYNQMGQMGYNQMACNQMGCGQVWDSQQWTIALTMKRSSVWVSPEHRGTTERNDKSKVADECKGIMTWIYKSSTTKNVDMHRYAIYLRLGRGLEISKLLCLVGSLVSGLAVARQPMAGSDGPNGPGDNRGALGELCKVCFAVQCKADTLIHWLVDWSIDWLVLEDHCYDPFTATLHQAAWGQDGISAYLVWYYDARLLIRSPCCMQQIFPLDSMSWGIGKFFGLRLWKLRSLQLRNLDLIRTWWRLQDKRKAYIWCIHHTNMCNFNWATAMDHRITGQVGGKVLVLE